MRLNMQYPRITINVIVATCLLCGAFVVFTLSCTSVTIEKEKTNNYTFTALSSTLEKSNDSIDNTATYTVPFELAENAQCMEITVIATDTAGKRVRCGFILESEVDTSRFPKKPVKPVYTVLAKNFDINWRFQSNIVFCSDKTDPLKRLNKGNYRLRISAFSDKPFTFEIQIKTQAALQFKK